MALRICSELSETSWAICRARAMEDQQLLDCCWSLYLLLKKKKKCYPNWLQSVGVILIIVFTNFLSVGRYSLFKDVSLFIIIRRLSSSKVSNLVYSIRFLGSQESGFLMIHIIKASSYCNG